MYFASSFFLTCCGYLLQSNDTKASINETHFGDLKTEENDTTGNDVYLKKHPSWIVSASNAKLFPVNLTDNDAVSVAESDTSILKPLTEPNFNNRLFSENNSSNKESNVLRIKLLNNGSPSTSPVVIHRSNLTLDDNKTESTTTKVHPQINATVLSTLYSPPEKEPSKEHLPWYKTSVFYQIYPRSFKDTTKSGVGDLAGVAEKADYLKELGVGAVWLSPFYLSPMADFGYDVADFRKVDPVFGTMKDFDQLLKELHLRDIKLIVDFIPNHSSDQHEWFRKSVNEEEPYTDYYLWQNPTKYNKTGHPIAPNNWLSVFGGPAWEWSEKRKQFYLHQFLKEQPDLNVRNPRVMEELDNILIFWLEKGVDGFRIDAIKHLFETNDFALDEPLSSSAAEVASNQYDFLTHNCSTNQPETIDAIRRWRKIIDKYPDRVLITEIYDDDINEIMRYYDTGEDLRSHFPFNFYLITELRNRTDVTGQKLKEIANKWLKRVSLEGRWPNWVLGNHDRARVASRLGKDLVDSLNMFLLLLPGTPTTYYGEEIGMEDNFIPFEEAKDPFGINFGEESFTQFGRDPQRTPMQWDDTLNAGFSVANETWLPVNPNYMTINVKAQRQRNGSHLNIYKEIAQLRREPTFQRGEFSFPFASDKIIVLERSLATFPTYMLIINTSENEIELKDELDSDSQQSVEVVICSSCPKELFGKILELSSMTLKPAEGIVVQLHLI